MITGTLLLAAWMAAAPTAAAPGAPTRLVLRNGTVYMLKEPPRISGTRVVFTTTEGTLYSMDQSEIEAIGSAPERAAPQRSYNTQDSRELGAIARQQRDARGKRAEVAPRAASRRRPKAVSSPRPRPTPRRKVSPAAPAAGKTSPG